MREPYPMHPQEPFSVASHVDRREFLKGATAQAIGTGLALATRRAGALSTLRQAASDTMLPHPARHWPRRPLLRENPADSLYARDLIKPVYEAQVIDDMERNGNWSASAVVEMAYTTERARAGGWSLRFKAPLRSEGYIHANRLPDGSFNGAALYIDAPPFAASMRLRLDPPQDWSRFNRISVWCYVHPTGQPLHQLCLQFLSLGAPAGPTEPVAMHFVQDLRPGEWNRIVWEIPEFRRDKVSEFVIFQPMIGLPRASAGAAAVYDFDLLQVERVDAEPYEGWEVVPGKIAYDHIGYLPSAEKVALTGEGPEDEFDVVDAATGRVVARYPIRAVKNGRGRFRVLDFTALPDPDDTASTVARRERGLSPSRTISGMG